MLFFYIKIASFSKEACTRRAIWHTGIEDTNEIQFFAKGAKSASGLTFFAHCFEKVRPRHTFIKLCTSSEERFHFHCLYYYLVIHLINKHLGHGL